ncbi:hypothetical protein C0Q70_03243 [Pomacea canaliculata]|uniref:Sulfotransferase domain-containing protein n=1 Tax=Pomacea canaliculata TaxID=400727 RepID=A0A2T7PS70_POMCA|nr:hypothetical protein C0Q70_03243 [Pomacea canaliculata]
MPVIHAIDSGGNTMKALYVEGCFFPFFPFTKDPKRHLSNIRNLPIRDDDLLLWGYPRTGCHWLWEMICMLSKGSVQYDANTKENYMLDFMTPEMLEAMPSPRTLNSHFYFHHLPAQTKEKKIKFVVLHRDPKDTVVSYYSFMKGFAELFDYNGTFSHFLELFLEGTLPYGSFIDFEQHIMQTLEDNPDIPVLHVFYEDLLKNCAEELLKVQRFLGYAADEKLCSGIAAACEFKKLKQVIVDRPDPLRGDHKEGFEGVCRKGVIGDWKNFFSKEEEAAFNEPTLVEKCL